MKRRIIFLIVVLLVLLLSLAWPVIRIGVDRMRMSYPDYFQKYAAVGVADKEDPAFKALNDRYGLESGNPGTFGTETSVGVWVYYQLLSSNFITLNLEKSIYSKELSLTAQFCATNEFGLPDYGNPKILMDIPTNQLRLIIEEGIATNIQMVFIEAAKSTRWQKVRGESYKPIEDVVLTYPRADL